MLKREFVKSYNRRFGESFVNDMIKKINKPYNQYLRVNTLKIKVDELAKRLKEKGFVIQRDKDVPYAYKIVQEPFGISSTVEYLLGYFYLQDKASMMPVVEMNPLKTDVILDAASAPGGKTGHIAQLMNNEGLIVAADNSIERLKAQLFNLQRLGVKNVASFHMTNLEIKKIGLMYDKVLLDAPCSATGTIWREKKRAKSVNKHVVSMMSDLQKEMIRTSSNVLKQNGLFVYSTCSIEEEENEDNISYAESKLGLKVLKTKYLFPQVDDTIGFYYAVMKK